MNKLLDFIKKYYKYIIGVCCVIITLAIVEDVFEREIMRCDIIAHEFFINTLRNDKLTKFMKIITDFGSARYLIVISLLSFLVIKNKRKSFGILFNLLLITILNLVLKNIVERPRPEGFMLIDETGYSFPSGHSMVSMAFYGFIIYLIFKYLKNKPLKYILCSILGILIVLIGSSRIYLGVHYVSDVIAGALISITYLFLYTNIIKRYINKKEVSYEK